MKNTLISSVIAAVVFGQLISRDVHAGSKKSRSQSNKLVPINRSNSESKKLPRQFRGKLLSSRNVDQRLPVLREIEYRYMKYPEVAGLLYESIKRAKKTRKRTAVWKMLDLFGQTDHPNAREELTEVIDSRDLRETMVAIERLGESNNAAVLPRLPKVIKRPEYKQYYGFRHCVIHAASKSRQPSSVGFLIDRVGELDGQLKYLTVRHLVGVTGKNFGADAIEWQKWWDGNQKSFVFASAKEDPTKDIPRVEIPWDYDVPKFYDRDLYAKRVVFVVDRSNSMMSTVDGETRIERARKELIRVTQGLTEDTWFNILVFNDKLSPWRDKLVPATRSNKRMAMNFAKTLSAGGNTASYDAVEFGLGLDSNTELLVFLTDRKPTTGRIVDPPQIVKAITEMNQFRRTTIDALGIDTRDKTERFMQELAGKNFGDYIAIR